MDPTKKMTIPPPADAESHKPAADNIFVGRQPIYTADLATFAYELLFRSSQQNAANFVDGTSATAQLLLNTFAEIGLERIVGTLPAFINVPEEFILKGHCLALPKERVVLEVLEDVKPTADVLAALSQLHDEGYTIALDDFVLAPELIPLVKLADIIKVELPAIPQSEWATHVKELRKFDVKLLAEKVETPEEFEICKQLEFDYYQGYFFCRPTIVAGRQVPANRLSMLRLISKLQKPTVSLSEVSEVIQTEPALALKLLRYVNSASSSLNRPVESIKHAVTIAGINRIKTIACLSALTEIRSDKPMELIETVLIRARMAELLAVAMQKTNFDSYFLAGLFSGLDALLDLPMKEALAMVPVSSEVAEALQHRTGDVGAVLKCVIDYERGNWESAALQSFNDKVIREAYMQAIDWVTASLAEI